MIRNRFFNKSVCIFRFKSIGLILCFGKRARAYLFEKTRLCKQRIWRRIWKTVYLVKSLPFGSASFLLAWSSILSSLLFSSSSFALSDEYFRLSFYWEGIFTPWGVFLVSYLNPIRFLSLSFQSRPFYTGFCLSFGLATAKFCKQFNKFMIREEGVSRLTML